MRRSSCCFLPSHPANLTANRLNNGCAIKLDQSNSQISRSNLTSQRLVSFNVRSYAAAGEVPGGGGAVEAEALDAVRESEKLQRTNPEPVQIEFIPVQSMARGGRMCVVVVVPSLAERQQRYPPTVARIVAGFETCSPPQMSRRIHQPRRVQRKCQPKEHSPQQHAPASKNKKRNSHYQKRNVVEAIQPTIVTVFK